MAQIIHVGSGSGEKRANVIFLHGLGGDPLKTWRHSPGDDAFWPSWLINDIDGLAVFSVGYDSPISRWNGTAMHLTNQANNVLSRILATPELQTGKVVLIGHSLGGLVIKQLVRTAESRARYDADITRFLERVEKVAFLATPHAGSGLANWVDRLGIAFRPSAATASLVRNDPNLQDLNLWYRDWANDRPMSHLTLTEAIGVRILVRVVKPDSSDAGLTGCRPISITADHFTICKPIDADHDTYVLVRKFIATPFERPKDKTEEKLQSIDSKVDQLVAALAERGDTANAEKAGVTTEAIIRLAQRIDASIGDFDQALLELERAVTVAAKVAEEGRRGSNAGDFVDVVLARIAEKSNAGLYDQAAAEADSAFAQWEREEKERREAVAADGTKLLEAGLNQDILRLDAVSAAKRIERMVELEHPDDRAARFTALRKRQDEWYISGRDKGLNLDLLVSIHVARLSLGSSSGPNETGAALIDLGMSLTELGQRESGTARLEEAVETFRFALLELTRRRAPLDWAMTQNNLGAVLRILAERQGSAARYREAVEAYKAALLERTRERFPLEWAVTQNNLGNALARMGEGESGTEQLEAAVEAYRAALLEQTRTRAPRDWATTQNNLGAALRVLADREGSTERLEQAVEAYRAALLERTKEEVPLDWAATQNNLGNALLSLGARESDTTRLQEAVYAFRAALLEYRHERAPYWHDLVQRNLASALRMLEQRRKGAS